MSESLAAAARGASLQSGTGVPRCSPEFSCRFAIAARALWPRKTAAELAYRAKVSERAAKFWLAGEREPSFDALMVILHEIKGRR